MESQMIIVKQLMNPQNPKQGMKYIGANDYCSPKLGRDGKIITGLDDKAVDVINMDEGSAKKQKQKELLSLRKELEILLNIESLDTNSSFWDDYSIILNDDLKLDPSNPRDRLAEVFLVANKYVAPSEESIYDDEDYQTCIFYLHREKEVENKKVQKQREIDKAKAKLVSIADGNTNTLKSLGSYILGIDCTDLDADEVYGKLTFWIQEEAGRAAEFMLAASKNPEELEIKRLLDKAINKRIVTTRGGVYRKGEDVYGKSYEDALQYLGSIENSGELSELKKAVFK